MMLARLSTLLAALAWLTPCFALDAGLALTQASHTAWRVRDGVFAAPPLAIAQTTDGQLWVGGESGLLRFDGVRFEPLVLAAGERLPDQRVTALLGASDGSLWIGTGLGLARLKDGHLRTFAEGGRFETLLEDRRGAIWAGHYQNLLQLAPLCRYAAGSFECFRFSDANDSNHVASLAQDANGDVWFSGLGMACRWLDPGFHCESLPPPIQPSDRLDNLVVAPDGALVATIGRRGDWRFADGRWTRVPPSVDEGLEMRALLAARDGALWFGATQHGLLRSRRGVTERFTQADGLSSDSVTRIFEDRDGDVWVATAEGLDRFRDLAVTTYTAREGLPAAPVHSLTATSDGAIWMSAETGLVRMKDGRMTSWEIKRDLDLEFLFALASDNAGGLWIGGGSHLLHFEHGAFHRVGFARMHVQDPEMRAMAMDARGSLWVATTDDLATLVELHDGRVVRVFDLHRLGNQVGAMAADPDGSLWVLRAGTAGLARIRDGKIETIRAGQLVRGRELVVDRRGPWIGTSHGLVFLHGATAEVLDATRGLPCDEVQALVKLPDGGFWMRLSCGFVQLSGAQLDAWVRDPKQHVQPRELDALDGARSGFAQCWPRAAASPDGRLWFAAEDVGVQVFDPRASGVGRPAPAVGLSGLVADRVAHDVISPVRLPPLVRDLEIRYTAYDPAAPERLRFRYRLLGDGRDREWHDAADRRGAYFTDLAPGAYRFEVTVRDGEGPWGIAPAVAQFEIAPAWFQTLWLKLGLAALACALLATAWRVRRRTLAARESARLRAMEAKRFEQMGALAGGIAHDFNNILGAILGYGARARRDAPDRTRLRGDLDHIVAAGERGRALVDRILAYSRGSGVAPAAVHVEAIVAEAVELLRAQLPARVELDVRLRAGRAAIQGDPTEVHQLVMNLGTNALHAMPDGGTLTVALEVASIGTSRPMRIGAAEPGDWVVLTVSDTGSGMPADVLARIFDPFFTTRASSAGTGLGLALVARIVIDAGGAIDVETAPGAGSTFRIHLPRSGDAPQERPSTIAELPRGRGERVIVVDDEAPLADLLADTLQELGYRAQAFSSGSAALAALQADPTGFEALLTDEQGRDLDGPSLIRAARRCAPLMPMFLVSGNLDAPERGAHAEAIDEILRKPLGARELAIALARAFQ